MINYNNGKIYAIKGRKTEKIYIGSTTTTLTKRLSQHKHTINAKRTTTSKEIINDGDYFIELLEDYPCENLKQLQEREGEYIREYKSNGYNCVNKIIVGRTHKEYVKDWYQNNKSNVLARHTEYKKVRVPCDICGKEMRRDSITRHKKKVHMNSFNN